MNSETHTHKKKFIHSFRNTTLETKSPVPHIIAVLLRGVRKTLFQLKAPKCQHYTEPHHEIQLDELQDRTTRKAIECLRVHLSF